MTKVKMKLTLSKESNSDTCINEIKSLMDFIEEAHKDFLRNEEKRKLGIEIVKRIEQRFFLTLLCLSEINISFLSKLDFPLSYTNKQSERFILIVFHALETIKTFGDKIKKSNVISFFNAMKINNGITKYLLDI